MNEVGCAQKLYAGTTSEHIPNWTISVLNFARKNPSTSFFFDPTRLISMSSFVLDGV